MLNAPVPFIALGKPGWASSATRIRPASQYIKPHEYGEDASKKTGLWLKNLPHLKPTETVDPRIVNGKPRWANQTDSGQNRLSPGADRWIERSRTYQGWADAMARQWADYVVEQYERIQVCSMTNNTVNDSNCPVCTEVAIRVQQIAQERDGYMLAALEMQDELNRLRHFKAATLRLARDMPGSPG